MARIKIKDLDVDLEELKKRDPEILKKIRGGAVASLPPSYQCLGKVSYLAPTLVGCQVSGLAGPLGYGWKC